MIPVNREQLEGLSETLHLLRMARVDAPPAYIMARIRKDKLPLLRMTFLAEIEEHFLEIHGMAAHDAASAADLSDVVDAAVRVQVADETIHYVLKGDLVINRDEGLLKLDNGDTLQVLFPRGLQLKVSFEESPTIMLGSCCESLEFYLARANPQFHYDPTGYHSGEERKE